MITFYHEFYSSGLQEKIQFDEVRQPLPREVAVNLKLITDRQEILQHGPIESNTHRFEENVQRDREVNLVMGLQQDIRQRAESRKTVHHNTEEIYNEVRKEQVEYIAPPPPKVKGTRFEFFGS